MKSKKIHKKKL